MYLRPHSTTPTSLRGCRRVGRVGEDPREDVGVGVVECGLQRAAALQMVAERQAFIPTLRVCFSSLIGTSAVQLYASERERVLFQNDLRQPSHQSATEPEHAAKVFALPNSSRMRQRAESGLREYFPSRWR